MNREWLILCFLVIIVLLSGCGVNDKSQGNYTPEYKDESLKMESKVTGKVLPSQAINMKVYLKSQAEDVIKNVDLRITDFYGLKLLSQVCPDGNDLKNSDTDKTVCGFVSDKCGCHFNEIQSLDEKEINFVFKVPTAEELARIGRELKPEFTLKYDYWGEATYLIPILGLNEKSTDAKDNLVKTKGSINVKIERGFTSSSDPWEKEGSSFSIVVTVEDVVNSRNELVIPKENFTMTLNNLERDMSSGVLCNFINITSTLTPIENITIPMDTPLVCALKGYSQGAPWVYGEVKAYFTYRYKVVETETIEVETVIV